MEAFLWIEQRYYHDIRVDLSDLKKKKFRSDNGTDGEKENSNQPSSDGRMSLGPNLKENKVYQKIKAQT